MKIIEVSDLALEGVKVLRFGRFPDERGYFTEHYRKSDLISREDFQTGEFVQCNESFSRAGTIRGLHFQWSPYMGKLVRTLSGRMVDFILDIRKGSSTFGKIIGYDMPAARGEAYDEWIWMPPGFAHGNMFPEDTLIEYFCTGEYSPTTEAGISPFTTDIDWSLCAPDLKRLFDSIASTTKLVTDKDRNGYSLAAWTASPLSENFRYADLPK